MDTRGALLAAARRLFAARGYEGSSIRAITAAADANLGSVTYHFGTKAALYEAVLESVTSPLLARTRAAASRTDRPLDGIEAVIREFFAHLAENPDWPAFAAHELMREGGSPAPLRRTMQGLLEVIGGWIRAGQADGSIVAGNPVLLTFSIVSQPIYLGLVRRRLREVFGLDADDPETRAQFVDHVVQFVRRSLATSGRCT